MLSELLFFASILTLPFEQECSYEDPVCICAFQEVIPANYGYVGYTSGPGVGYRDGYGTLGFFLAPSCLYNCFLPLLDIRGHVFDNRKDGALNVGVGLRYVQSSVAYGANVFYDFRSLRGKNFNQIGFGLEFFNCYFDARINGYLPLGDRTQSIRKKHFFYPGDYHVFCQEKTTALPGGDFDLSTTYSHFCPNDCTWDLVVGSGPYLFKPPHRRTVVGVRARLGIQLLDYFYVEGRYSHDSVFKNRLQGVIVLTIPFGKNCDTCVQRCCLDYLHQIATEPIWRNEIIILDRSSCHYEPNY